jgi:hypothetical protein
MQRLTRGHSFASTPSPYLFADDPQDSFVGIAPARLLPGTSTTSKNRISLPTFSGVTHILTIANADMTLLSHQHCRRISSRSSMSKIVCGKRIPLIVNSVLSRFQTATTRRLKHHLSYHFLRNTRLAHRSDELPDRRWRSIWRRDRSFF